MRKINLEIVKYIDNSELDSTLKGLLKEAIIFEYENKDSRNNRYKTSYKSMIDKVVGED